MLPAQKSYSSSTSNSYPEKSTGSVVSSSAHAITCVVKMTRKVVMSLSMYVFIFASCCGVKTRFPRPRVEGVAIPAGPIGAARRNEDTVGPVALGKDCGKHVTGSGFRGLNTYRGMTNYLTTLYPILSVHWQVMMKGLPCLSLPGSVLRGVSFLLLLFPLYLIA